MGCTKRIGQAIAPRPAEEVGIVERFRALLVAVGVALAGLVMPSRAISAAEFTLRLNHTLPATHLRQRHAELFQRMVSEATNGRVQVVVYPAGQLFRSDQQAIQAVRSGAIEGAMVTTGDLSLYEPGFGLFELPFLFENYVQLDAVEDSEVGKELLARLERLGLKGLAFTDAGSSILINRLRPVRKAEDLRGLRVRASAGRIQILAFELLGMSAIQLPAPDVVPALQRGTIDGVYTTPSAAVTLQLGRLARFGTWTRQQFFPPVVVVNLGFWNRLGPDLQGAIFQQMPTFMEEARKLNLAEEEEALNALREQGVDVVELESEARDAIREILARVYAEYRDVIGTDLVERARTVARSAQR